MDQHHDTALQSLLRQPQFGQQLLFRAPSYVVSQPECQIGNFEHPSARLQTFVVHGVHVSVLPTHALTSS